MIPPPPHTRGQRPSRSFLFPSLKVTKTGQPSRMFISIDLDDYRILMKKGKRGTLFHPGTHIFHDVPFSRQCGSRRPSLLLQGYLLQFSLLIVRQCDQGLGKEFENALRRRLTPRTIPLSSLVEGFFPLLD